MVALGREVDKRPATLEAAPGRATLVLGAGGDLAATLGPPRRGRVEAVAECVDVIRAMAAGGEVNYAGAHYRVAGLFSPWRNVTMDRLYLGANRPRMLRLAAQKADGVMMTDVPIAYAPSMIGRLRTELDDASRDPRTFGLSNWFVWNVQESRDDALRLARRQLGFRLYYIRDVAASIGLSETDAQELEARQPEMIRALFRGAEPWTPPAHVAERLIEHLTLTGDRQGLDGCVERLLEFERLGFGEIALAPHGDPAAAIELIGAAVIPAVDRAGDLRVS